MSSREGIAAPRPFRSTGSRAKGAANRIPDSGYCSAALTLAATSAGSQEAQSSSCFTMK